MAYKDGEELIFNLVCQMNGFSPQNVACADWTILNSGRSDHYAIIRRGAVSARAQMWQSPVTYTVPWVTAIEVWQKVLPDIAETHTRLYEHVETIMGLLEHPTLGDTGGRIQDADIPGMSEVEEMWRSDGGPVFLRVTIEVVWNEERILEYD